MKQRVLFRCTHSSTRSQMVEGLVRHAVFRAVRDAIDARVQAELLNG